MRKIFVSFLVLITCLILSLPSHATQIRQSPLDEMVTDSANSFCGICKNVEDDKAAKLQPLRPVKYTFEVTDVMKGGYSVGQIVSFTQISAIKGMPSYLKNNEYCILQSQTSSSGFTAPISLYNGVFSVLKDKDGARKIRAAEVSRGMFRDILKRRPAISKTLTVPERSIISDENPDKNRVISADDFISLIRKLGKSGERNK